MVLRAMTRLERSRRTQLNVARTLPMAQCSWNVTNRFPAGFDQERVTDRSSRHFLVAGIQRYSCVLSVSVPCCPVQSALSPPVT